jgi:hemerythrin
MSFIDWSEEENVKIEIIDEQHKNIVSLINELYEILGSSRNFLEKNLLERLLKNLRVHFDTEEKLMKESKFPNFISHKMEHDRFFNKIQNFYAQYENGDEKLNLELLNSIKRWLFNHLEINDRKCGKFFIEIGMK